MTPGRNIIPEGLTFVLERKASKRLLKSWRCKKQEHGKCGGLRNGLHSDTRRACECPCHKLEMDPTL